MPHLSLLLMLLFACILSVQCQGITPITLYGGGVGETTYGLPDVLASYSLANPAIKFKMITGSGPNNRAGVQQGDLDFGLTSGAMLLSESLTYPNITFLPIVATGIVPVIRLDEVSVQLTFSLKTLAYIYAGQLTNWNDSRIRADNPGVDLPDKPITVVTYGEPRYITDVWIRALNRALPAVAPILPTPDSGLSWPFTQYNQSLTGVGITGVAAVVVDNDGSIGYCIQSAALTTGARTAKVINQYGAPVQANTLSVSYAVSERSLQAIPNPLIQVPDLTGCTSMPCWPIVIPIFVTIENFFSPRGCAQKKALVEFLEFYYSSTDLTKKLLGAYQMVNIPPEVQESLNIRSQLASITCFGAPLSSKQTNVVGDYVSVGTPELMREFLEAESDFYQLVDASFSFNVITETPAQGVTAVQSKQVAANFYYPGELAAYQALSGNRVNLDTTNFLHLPMYLTSIALVYNPVLVMTSANTSYSLNAARQLTIDADLIAQVMLGDIRNWTDSKWLPYNPWLPTVMIDQTISAPVTFVLGCMRNVGQAPMTARLFYWIQQHLIDQSLITRFDQAFNPTINSTTSQSFWRCQRNPLLPALIYSTKETAHQQLISSKPGSFSFIRDNLDGQTNKFSLMFNGAKRQSNSPTMKNCVAAQANAELMNFDVESGAISNSTCWPLTRVLTAQVPKDYQLDGVTAWRTLSWLHTIVNSSSADYWSDSLMVIRVAQHPGMQQLLTDALYSVVANGETVIVTWPVVWQLSQSIELFGAIFVALIGLATIGSIVFFVLFRNYKIIRSNSPMFMCLSLLGILMLVACIQLLVSPPSDATCSAVNWMANLGFQVTFMPLFAKAWRIYRIFGGRKLQVVKINNRKLAVIVAIGLSMETIFLIIWQAVAPATALTVVTWENNREHHYVQCGYSDTSMDFFLVAVIVKICLVLFGVRMAFGTRQVSDEFSESKSIAVAIYNVIVAVGLIAALVVLMDTVGDTLILLLVFCAIWVSLVTLFIMVGPRVLAFADSRRPRNGVDPALTMSRSSLSGEYSFLSLTVLNNLQMAITYMQSLESHLGDVRAKVSQLRGHITLETSTQKGSLKGPSPRPSPSKSAHALSPKIATLTPSELRRVSLQNKLNNSSRSSGGSTATTLNTRIASDAPSVVISPTAASDNAKAPNSPTPNKAPRFSHSLQMTTTGVKSAITSVNKGTWL